MISTFLILTGLVFGGITGYLVGRSPRGKSANPDTDQELLLQRRVRELSAELQKIRDERNQDIAVAIQIPAIVKKLGEKLPVNAIPGIAIRLAKGLFPSPTLGFFAPLKGNGNFALVEGVGFPPEWKSDRYFSSQNGILGTTVQMRTVMAKEDYLGARSSWPLPPSTMEEAGVLPDLVAPVIWEDTLYGVLVVAGSSVPLDKKRPYASLLADMVASAFRNSFSLDAADLQASTDHLTGLHNRTAFAQHFEAEMRRAKNYMGSLSLLIFDIDHFKKVNDTHGHPAGDVILKRLSEIIRKITRSSDFVARYGGEEFVVVMNSSDKDQALIYANTLCKTIAATGIRIPGEEAPLKVTISGGIATYPDDGESTTELVKSADEALYIAKNKGRNRVATTPRVGLDGRSF